MSPSNITTPPPPGFGENDKSSEPKKTNQLIHDEARRLQVALARSQRDAALHAPTDKLSSADQRALPAVLLSSYGYDIGDADKFMPLPRMLAAVRDRHSLKLWFWRIEFEGIAPGRGPIGFDLFSDSVIGRDPSDSEIVDIDLGEYEAFDKGVSRRHALLRPTRNKLYVIDLDSTNGTRVNSLTIGHGRAMEIHSGDTITLGRLSFTVKVILTPEQTTLREEEALQEQKPPASPEVEPFQKLPEKPAAAPHSGEKDAVQRTSANDNNPIVSPPAEDPAS